MIPVDIVNGLVNKRRPRRDKVDQLRGLLWITHLLETNSLTLGEFDELVDNSEKDSSGLAYKWMEGKNTPSRSSVNRIANLLPSSDSVYNLPLYELLKPYEIKFNRAKKLVSPYVKEGALGIDTWHFPDNFLNSPAREMFILEDYPELKARSDIYGLMGLVFLLREAECKSWPWFHINRSTELIEALPGIGKCTWISPHWELLKSCINDLISRAPFTPIIVDWDVLDSHFYDEEYIARRELRKRNPINNRFIEYASPVLGVRGMVNE